MQQESRCRGRGKSQDAGEGQDICSKSQDAGAEARQMQKEEEGG